MKVSNDTRARLAKLVAQGTLSAAVVETLLAETEAVGDCIACGRKCQPRDYVCGGCSSLKVRAERRFWQSVTEREKTIGTIRSVETGVFPVSPAVA